MSSYNSQLQSLDSLLAHGRCFLLSAVYKQLNYPLSSAIFNGLWVLSSGLKYQQIYYIDLNLQDMKNKHQTVLFGLWLLLAFRVHAFRISMQIWEPEVLLFVNWEMRYYRGRCIGWGINLFKLPQNIVGLPAQAVLVGQWTNYYAGKNL